jgi:hypothetical protein
VVASFGQQRLWFMAQLDPLSPVYNTVSSLRLGLPVDVGALGWAIDALVARHESLRTTFTAIDGQPFQRVHPHLPVVLRALADHDAAQRLAREPFDLDSGPLLRTGLLSSDGLLIVCLHHIITDGWSMRIFFDELNALYDARRHRRQATLPALTIQYPDYALWQRQQLTGTRLQTLLGFWRTELHELSTLQLPTDHPRPTIPSFRGASIPITIPATTTTTLRTLAHQHNATLFMTLLAAFAALLSRYTNQTGAALLEGGSVRRSG